MTNAEIIATIRNEIERLHAQHSSKYGTDEAGLVLERLEDFLSTLESEKPMEHKDIDTEIGHWIGCLDDKYCMLVNHYSIQDIKDTALHFYGLGCHRTAEKYDEIEYNRQRAEESEKPSEGLEDILLEFYDEYNSNVENRPIVPRIYAEKLARHFAEWGAEHLKK